MYSNTCIQRLKAIAKAVPRAFMRRKDMGLDSTVYEDDEAKRKLTSVRIRNLAAVVYLEESVNRAGFS